MTKKELVFIRIGIFLILLTIIFPPWRRVRVWDTANFEYSKSYRFESIFTPPADYVGNDGTHVILGSSIDIPRLLMLWTAIVLVCGYFILIPRLMKSKNINDETAKEE